MVNFVEYVVAELKSKRLSKSAAFELIRQFSSRPAATAAGGAALHPLLQANVSDIDRLAFRSRLGGSEPFLADHRVAFAGGDASVLPAVAYLEMARAALQQAVPAAARDQVLELRHCVWAQPLVVRAATTVSLELAPNTDGGIDYDILSGEGEQQAEHCQGHAQFVAPADVPSLDIAALRGQMQRGSLATAEVYAGFAAMGLHYGPAHQAVQQVFIGEGQVLARLELPQCVRAQAAPFVLHPSLLDGALQAAIGLMPGETRPRLPFAVDLVRVFAACPPQLWVWLRQAPGSVVGDALSKLDIDLCGADGKVCVQMRGFSARALAPAGVAAEESAGVLRAVPHWQPVAPDAQPAVWAQRHVIACELPAVDAAALQGALADSACQVLGARVGDDLAQRYSDHTVACVQYLQDLLAAKPAGAQLLQLAVPAAGEAAVFAGLGALLLSAAQENPQLQVQLLQVAIDSDAAVLARQLVQARSHATETRLRFDATDSVQALRWQEYAASAVAPVFKEHGVYLISGGLGGLGTLFAREILQQTRNAQVILSGRGDVAGERQARLQALQALAPGRVHYRAADPADAAAARALIDGIVAEHGALHGILHSAGMNDDGFLASRSAAGVRAVLAPKVQGSVHLDQASRALALDFFAAFSSVAGILGNVGQADYAAANAFLDEFAAYRNALVAAGQRRGHSCAIAWPLWQDGGMALAPELQAALEQRSGMQPLASAEGLQAFHQCLAQAHARSVVLQGRLPALRRSLANTSSRPVVAAQAGAEALPGQELRERTQEWLRRQFSQLLKVPAQRIEPRAPLERYGIDSILAMRLTNTLEQTFGSLSKTLLFEHRSIADLAAHFAETQAAALNALFARGRSSAPAAAAAAAVAAAALPEQVLSPRQRRAQSRRSAAPVAAAATTAEPIAIVGLSGRYPEARDLAAYWENLRAGRDCIVEIPASRWDWRDYYSEDRREDGRHYSRWGGFIEGVDEFDPLFFNMSPLEAERIDPQERLFLQQAWMAVEDAGYTRADLHGQAPRQGLADIGGQVGVYVGVMYSEYQLFGAEASLRGQRTGLAGSFASIANRVSYALDLHGPSMTLDTMCSSSLTAIHLACQDLRQGRTRLAIAGGVNVTIHPNKYLVLSSGQFISSDGHCQSFGEGGDGYIPGEGVGAVVLKRLSDAQRDGDHIYGVIRGSALSHGGRTNGYTVPNPQAQTSAIALALGEARVDARHISYIEAHGTGTKLGDPIEIAALNKAFGQYTQDKQYCLIGSAKSNIGHCEAAAGIAGLTKVLLQLKHRQIAPSLHSRTLNPHIDFGASPFIVNQELTDWAAPVVHGQVLPRIAGISSFGAGGSNAHLIVEEYSAAAVTVAAQAEAAVLLSARTQEQLRQRAADLCAFVAAAPDTDLTALAFTLQTGREAMDERLGLVTGNTAELRQKLQAWLAGDSDVEELHQAQVQRHRDTLALFSSDADLQQTVARWLTGGKLGKVVELWSKGLEVDWAGLYTAGRPARISLPAYPFARERYWIDLPAGNAVASGGQLHPLLHTNVSDLGRQCYRSVFGGGESWLADHRVLLGGSEQRVLPAVAYLEMARAAAEQAVPAAWRSGVLELRHCVWAQPLTVAQPTQVGIVLEAAADGAVDYAIVSGDDENPCEHSRGQAVYVDEAAAQRVDIAALRQRLDGTGWTAAQLYAALESLGLRYGPAHRAVRQLYCGAGEVLARLELPDCVRAQAQDYVLHPSLLDAALQSALALSADAGQARLPFALDSLRVYAKPGATLWAWLRPAASGGGDTAVQRLDIDLCDEHGAVAVQLRGFSSRALPAQDAAQGVLAALPQWRAVGVAAAPIAWAQRVVVLCELPQLDAAALQALLPGSRCSSLGAAPAADLAARYTAHALAAFDTVRELLAAPSSAPLLLQWVIGDGAEESVFAGIAALLKSAALENPRFHGQVVITGREVAAEILARQLEQAQAHPREAQLRFAGDAAPLGLRWQEQAVTTVPPAAFKPQGVYLITGGLGGLGMLFARAIAAQAPAARIVLTGRGELDDARRERLAELNAAGAQVQYRALDLLDAAAVEATVAAIVQEYGALDGVLHSAGMLADGFLVHKSAADFSAVLAPKVAGTVNLDHATRQLDLQFFALFSSLAGAFGNIGQADYACANGFLDEFASYRNKRVAAGERRGLSLAINWPLWRDGGMQLSAALQEQLARATGMGTLSSDNGLQAFARALELGLERSLVMQGDLAPMRRTVSGPQQAAVVETAPAARPLPAATSAPAISAVAVVADAAGDPAERTREWLRQQFAAALKLPPQRVDVEVPLENYGIDSILAMRLTTLLEQTFGTLSKTLFFEYQSIAALAGYLAGEFPQIIERVTAAPAAAEAVPAVAKAARPAAQAFVPRRAFGSAPAARGRDVAIVGLAGRYPQAEDVDSFWQLLREGRDCISEIPAERWDHALYFDPDRNKPGKSYSKWGGFIADIDKFDPLFFNIAPREAELLDPQERLFLETAWQVIEDAGYSRQSLAGTRTGVYVGVMWGQYELYGVNSLAAGHVGVPSSSQASIANRVSYFFNLHGPSLALDTMCSSSLTAIHLACEEIRRGNIDAAIAGGVNVSVHPHKYLTLSQGKFAASDGRCRSFGAGGDGYVPGEGVGAVLLKPLEHALRDGDHVYGVVRASSINHGGKTNGYTVPNPLAQAQLIQAALEQAQIAPQSLSYIEAHGTGTALGDPIEITGLSKAFASLGGAGQDCAIGSVKSNIGHLESAAGIAAMTKVLLQLRHAELVPSLHAEPANPHIDFGSTPFRVQTTLAPWPRRDGAPRRSGISSFGAGGANAHMVVEEFVDTRAAAPTAGNQLFVLSARSPRTLLRHAQRMAAFLAGNAQLAAEQVAYTLQVGRSGMNARLACVADDLAGFVAALQCWIAAQDDAAPVQAANAMEPAMAVPPMLYGNSSDGSSDALLLVEGAAGRGFLRELLQQRDLPRLARLWTLGAEIDWSLLHAGTAPRRVSLPTYPFERQRYWLPLPAAAQGVAALSAANTPMLSAANTSVSLPAADAAELPQRLHYGVSWQRAPLPPAAPATARLLLLDCSDTVFRALAAQHASAPLLRVRFGNSYRELGPAEFELRAGEEADFQRLFAALKERGQLPQVILHRCSDGLTLEQSLPAAAALYEPVSVLLQVARALLALSAAARYLVIADAAAPQHQALAAFLKTLALEQPAFSGKVVSIDCEAGLSLAGEVAIAAAEIADARSGVEEIRYRCAGTATERCVRRIVRDTVIPAALDRMPLRHGGVYLITGGLGGLGLLFGEYLAQHYAARLVLVGRSASTPQHEQRLARLRRHAAEIVYMQADVARAEDAERVVREIRARYGSLSGVIHAAGVTRDGLVRNKSSADLRAVFDPKIGGAIQLDHATRDEALDLFVLFASIAGVNGNVGQGDYAYANQFLDAFAERRERQHAAGLRRGRTLSIAWPLWRDGGMQIGAEQVALLEARTGLQPLPTDEGLRLFEEMLCLPRSQGIAVYGLASRIDAYVSGTRDAQASAARVAAASVVARPVATPSSTGDLLAQTLGYVKSLVGEEIRLAPEHIDARERLESFGLDSVAIAKVTAALERDLGELPKTLLYEHETVADIAGFLVREHAAGLRALLAAQTVPGDAAMPIEAANLAAIAPSAVAVSSSAAEATAAAAMPQPVPLAAASAAASDSLSALLAAQSATQKIAIIGVHGHYPQAPDLDAFWQLLRAGRDATGPVPASRWDAEAFYDADPAAAGRGRIYCRNGGFIDDVDKFDTGLFRIAPEEASVMDPQERLFLQSVWSALEDAGYTRDTLRARHPRGKSADVGVFVGVTTNSYAQLAEDARRQGNMLTPSAMPWSIANRVSYFFDFKGPSLPVDTACSSSLVAVHMACESLRRGECQVAVAGGVNLYLHPSKYLSLCQRGMLARGGRTRSYGKGDDGFIPGEGVGSFILKPLEQALADGDRIHGVIAGSAFDHSGRSNGYSAPNPNAQAELIARTLAAAEVEPDAIGCVEGHGTGTPLGDSLEVLALSQAFRRNTERRGYCSLGSVKANIGHAESAAGAASLTKALLQVQHGEFVPSLHSTEVNPDLDLAASPFQLQQTLAAWPRSGNAPRSALVNSFGAGGVNACLVLEEHVAAGASAIAPPDATSVDTVQVLALSAESGDALRAYAQRFCDFLAAQPQIDLAALCHTVQIGREVLKERLAVIAAQPAELAARLRAWLAQGEGDLVYRGCVQARRSARRVAAADAPDATPLQRAQGCAQRWVAGEDPAWQRLHGETVPVRIAAPGYPFARERCWIVGEAAAVPVAAESTGVVERLHPLVSYNSSTLREVSFDSWLSSAHLAEFQLALHGAPVLPAAALLELACACASLAGDRRIRGARDVIWNQPLALAADMQLVRTYVKDIDGAIEYVVTSLDEGSRRSVHAEGCLLLGPRHDHSTAAMPSIAALKAQGTPLDAAAHYQRLQARGIACGAALRCVQELWCGNGSVLARLALAAAPESRGGHFVLHPALIDGALQTALALLDGSHARTAFVPLALEELSIVRRVAHSCYAHAQAAPGGRDDVRVFDISLLNEQGELLVLFKGLALKALQQAGSGTALAQAG